MKLLERAFGILQVVADAPNGVGVIAVAKQMDLPKSTVSRILVGLEAQGAVMRSAENQFTIGRTITQLAAQQSFAQSLSALARPILQQIAEETGETVAICVLDGLKSYYLDHVQSRQHAVQVRDWKGEHVPLHATSSGKVFLAWGSAELVNSALAKPLHKNTSHTLISQSALRQQLTQIRKQGYAISDEEFVDDIYGLAVPILAANQTIVAALNLYGPTYRFATSNQQNTHIPIIQQGAQKLAALWQRQ
ncbi:MAG: IclR family transcriptional regulator [Candidatus Promineifilaceae bacterium]